MKITFSILLLLFLQGCTIAYYETEDNLKNSSKPISKPTCDIIYSIKITTEQYHAVDTYEEKLKYIASTNKIFQDYNCSAKYEEDTTNTNFFINITVYCNFFSSWLIYRHLRSSYNKIWLDSGAI